MDKLLERFVTLDFFSGGKTYALVIVGIALAWAWPKLEPILEGWIGEDNLKAAMITFGGLVVASMRKATTNLQKEWAPK